MPSLLGRSSWYRSLLERIDNVVPNVSSMVEVFQKVNTTTFFNTIDSECVSFYPNSYHKLVIFDCNLFVIMS